MDVGKELGRKVGALLGFDDDSGLSSTLAAQVDFLFFSFCWSCEQQLALIFVRLLYPNSFVPFTRGVCKTFIFTINNSPNLRSFSFLNFAFSVLVHGE